MTDNYTHYEIRELKCHYSENINEMHYTCEEPIDPTFLFITPDGKRIAYSAVLREFRRVHDFMAGGIQLGIIMVNLTIKGFLRK